MPSLPTLPRRTRLESASLAFAGILFVLGIAGMAGWLGGASVAGGPGAATMSSTEALCFLLLGIVFFAHERGWRPIEWLAVLPGALGALRLAESLLGRSLHADLLFLNGSAASAAHPTNFSAMTAACLALSGTVLTWRAAQAQSATRQLAKAAVGSILAAVGCATLFGYAAGLSAVTNWGTATAVPGATALALLVVGLALLAAGWEQTARIAGEAPTWAPLPIVIWCLTLTLILWADLRQQERDNLNARTRLERDRLVTGLVPALDNDVSAVEHFAQSWGDEARWSTVEVLRSGVRGSAPGASAELWAADVAQLETPEMNESTFNTLGYVDRSGRTLRVFPPVQIGALGSDQTAEPHRQWAMNKVIQNGQSFISGSLDVGTLYGPQLGFAIYAPVRRNGELVGFATADFFYQRLFQGVATGITDDQIRPAADRDLAAGPSTIADDYSITVSVAGTPVYHTSVAPAAGAGLEQTDTYTIPWDPTGRHAIGRDITVTLTPSEALASDQGSLPKLVLAVGMIISALMGLTVHLALRARSGQRSAEKSNLRLRNEIDERRRVEVQLKHAKTEAEAGSRAKSEFLASMSHEIRTPMNGVIGMASLLMETKLTPEQSDFVSTIRASGDALLTIINEILDFSKIESGKMDIEHHPFELAPCVEETLDLFGMQAAAKRLELACLVAPDVPAWIVGDVTRLRQVIANLVNNAIKFTPSGSVTIEVRRGLMPPPPPKLEPPPRSAEDEAFEEEEPELGPAIAFRRSPLDPEFNPNLFALEVAVRDTGIGIPPERMDRLFKAFSQVDSSTTRKYGGTGLGLAICQRLCQLMGGGIRVESAPGQGSAFTFTVLTEPAPDAPTAEAAPPLPERLRGGTVLCVEDLPINQVRLHALFEAWGCACAVAANATEARNLAATMAKPPALLVLDDDGTADPPLLETLAHLACPRLILFPFGQTTPSAPAGGPAFDSISKPIKTGLVLHAAAGLFGPRRRDTGDRADQVNNRLLADEFPLEVLLAEDNAVNQKVALRYLERLGYRADVANNGREALNMLGLRHYDLVLMDMQMPEMDGLEASRQVRSRLPRDRQPTIIALTANAMRGDRDLCLAAGMDDHISKPVKLEEIAAAIRRHHGARKPART